MNNRRLVLILGVIVLVFLAIGVGLAAFFLRAPQEASAPIEAIPLETPTEEVVSEPVEVEPTEGEEAESAEPVGQRTFQIVQQESQVRFTLGEVLNGEPNTVVGVTDQVAGEMAVNFGLPSAAQIGEILINARTLVTDNNRRTRAINNFILDTATYEFIRFKPTSLSGLPESVTFGTPFAFQILGELTITDVTREVTFDATVTPISETRIEGLASVTILWADYGLSIPNVRQVASVDDEVLLEIDFVAVGE